MNQLCSATARCKVEKGLTQQWNYVGELCTQATE